MRSWENSIKGYWDFDVMHAKRNIVVLGKHITKFVFALAYLLFLTTWVKQNGKEQARFSSMGLVYIVASFLFCDLVTLILVFLRMFKVGRGCFNMNRTSGRNDNYFTRRVDFRFRWFEFLAPLISVASHVSSGNSVLF